MVANPIRMQATRSLMPCGQRLNEAQWSDQGRTEACDQHASVIPAVAKMTRWCLELHQFTNAKNLWRGLGTPNRVLSGDRKGQPPLKAKYELE
jgi:hypothetical protein